MKATEAKLLQILGAVSQFIIPIYQRTHSWTIKECKQLWADILRRVPPKRSASTSSARWYTSTRASATTPCRPPSW